MCCETFSNGAKGEGNVPTKQELESRIAALEEENDELQDALDQIADLAAPPDQGEEEEEGGEDDESGED